jgi:hypothetical protein
VGRRTLDSGIALYRESLAPQSGERVPKAGEGLVFAVSISENIRG